MTVSRNIPVHTNILLLDRPQAYCLFMVSSFVALTLLSLAVWEFWRYVKHLYLVPEKSGDVDQDADGPADCHCGKWRFSTGLAAVYDSYGLHETRLCQPMREVIR